MTVDLHIHTTASDGTVEPADIVSLALDAGLSAIAITDHDSVGGVARATAAAAGRPLEVIAGVELSANSAACPDAHVLGYFLDATSDDLLSTLESLRGRRIERAETMVRALEEAGYSVTLQGVLALAGEGAVGRSHVARALLEAGDVDTMEEAFRRLIGRDAPFYVEKRLLKAAEAVDLIHRGGGAAVLAHPGVSGDGALVELADAGLDGVEAYHAEHTESQRQHYVALARRLGLVATGGSDFHGPASKNARIGVGGCPDSAVQELQQRAAAHHQAVPGI